MTKKMVIVMVFGGILTCTSYGYDWSTNPGDGTDMNPYQISTPEQLMAIGDDPLLMDKFFELTGDIDMDPNVTGVPAFTSALIGSDSSPFLGLFWGKYHKIKNLKFVIPENYSDPVGLFSQVGEYNIVAPSTVWMLNIENCTIQSQESYVGILAGVNYGSIGNCRVTGHVEGNDRVGGIAGYTGFGGIVYCASQASVSGDEYVGGLIGEGYGGSVIMDSYAEGIVTGRSYVGGVIGYARQNTFQHCYSTAQVSGSSGVGGFMGDYYYSPQIISCYYLNTAGPNNGNGTPLIQQQMKQKASYVGWDFTPMVPDGLRHAWRLCQDGVYPRLFWEFTVRGDFACPDGVGAEDLLNLTDYWLSGNEACDANDDKTVNVKEFMILSQHWLGL